MKELDAIEARAKAASPAPWDFKHPESDAELRGPTLAARGFFELGAADLAFIAEARTDVPRLCAALRHVLAELDIDHGWKKRCDEVAAILRGERGA